MDAKAPILRGVVLATLAAALFGVTAPIVQRASAEAGALAAGALLYLGAAVTAGGGLLLRRLQKSEAPLRRRDASVLLGMAVLGGLLAPALLVLGLQRTDAAGGSLLLTLEAPFTFVLARIIYREHLGRRAWVAAALTTAAGILVVGGRPGDRLAAQGSLLVMGAVLCWALDNVLSRQLADRDPVMVVAGKGALGGAGAALVAAAASQSWPSVHNAVALLVVGGFGFGVSLQLYLRAQRIMGAARTASVFSTAPFLGAVTALLLGTPWPGWPLAVAAGLMILGVWLHGTERHRHEHRHAALEHEHAHTHDDGHHDHVHDPMPPGAHSHSHRHGPLAHEHEHGEDLHHRHAH